MLMPFQEKLSRFARKSSSDRWLAIKATVLNLAVAPSRVRAALDERYRRRQVFRDVYKRHLWGSDGRSTFFSGIGSRGECAEVYVRGMAELLECHGRELGRPLTVVDLGCGDFQIGRDLIARVPDLTYIGCDIVPELIEHNTRIYGTERVSFRQLDIVTDPLPVGDVCLVRQVLQHLSNAEITRFLQRAAYKYLYVTEGHPVISTGSINPDKAVGFDVRFDWRAGHGRGVELDKAPYCLATREVLRAHAHPAEVIITERVFTEQAN